MDTSTEEGRPGPVERFLTWFWNIVFLVVVVALFAAVIAAATSFLAAFGVPRWMGLTAGLAAAGYGTYEMLRTTTLLGELLPPMILTIVLCATLSPVFERAKQNREKRATPTAVLKPASTPAASQ